MRCSSVGVGGGAAGASAARVGSAATRQQTARSERSIFFMLVRLGGCGLNGFFASFICADADGVFDIGNENLAVTDFTGLGGLDDGGDGGIDAVVGGDDFQFDLGQE